MPVFLRNVTLSLFCLIIFAGCGGSSSDVAPEATAEPTLTAEERVEFVPGTVENPIQVIIRPVQHVLVELQTTLSEIASLPAQDITRETVLRDELSLGDGLTELAQPIDDTFSVMLNSTADLLTVGDLERFIQVELADQISQILFERTSIHFDVPIVDDYGTGLQSLCESNLGIVSMAWLDGITYASATDNGCGEPALQVVIVDGSYNVGLLADVALDEFLVEATPEVTAEATDDATSVTEIATSTATTTPLPTDTPTPEPTETPSADVQATPEATSEPLADIIGRAGTPVLFLVNRALGTTRVDVIRDRTYCRIDVNDYYSWLTATLIMRRNNIDPQTDILEILDFPQESALIRAVADGLCTATVLSEDTFESLSDILDNDVLDNIVIAEMTTPHPYAILAYPFEVQLGVRLTLNDVFVDLSTDDDAGAPLRWLLGHDAIVPANQSSFAAFDAYLETTGLDFGQLGN